MKNSFTEISPEVIAILKAKGYTCVQMTPKDDKPNYHRTVELIPLKTLEHALDLVSLDSPEINDYVGHQSPMAQYVIDIKYLKDPASA